MKPTRAEGCQVEQVESSTEDYVTASEGLGFVCDLTDIDRTSTVSISATTSRSDYSDEDAVYHPAQHAHEAKKAPSFSDSGFFSANNSSTNSFESFSEAPSVTDTPKTDCSSDCLHWNKSMGGDALSFLLEIELDLQGKAKGSPQVLDTIALPTTFEVPKLHWDWTMGGDAMSFLLSAEAELRKRADNGPVGGVV